MSKQKENRVIRIVKETGEDNCELSAEEKATKTLHYISLEGGDQNERQHLACTHYDEKFIRRKNNWNSDTLFKSDFPISLKKHRQKPQQRNKTLYSFGQRNHELPNSMLLQLTKSLAIVETSNDYKVRTKAKCQLGSSPRALTKEKLKIFVKKPEQRQKLRFSCHIIPTPTSDSPVHSQEKSVAKKEGGAIKKIKQDLIRSLECKIEAQQIVVNTIQHQLFKEDFPHNQSVNHYLNKTGFFREPVKLMMKKSRRINSQVSENLKKRLNCSSREINQRHKSSINHSQQFKLLSSLLSLQRH